LHFKLSLRFIIGDSEDRRYKPTLSPSLRDLTLQVSLERELLKNPFLSISTSIKLAGISILMSLMGLLLLMSNASLNVMSGVKGLSMFQMASAPKTLLFSPPLIIRKFTKTPTYSIGLKEIS
jgi:hypothetical protein